MISRSLTTLLAAMQLGLVAQALPAQVAPSQADTTRVGAPVIFFGDTLFTLYGRLGPFGPEERAAAATARVRRWITSPATTDADTLHVVEREGRSEVVAGETVLVTVLEEDALAVGLARGDLAAQVRSAIANAETARRGDFTIKSLLLGFLYAIIATVALVAIFRLLMRVFPKLYARIENQRSRQRLSLRIQQFDLVPANQVVNVLLIAAKTLRVTITLLLLYIYIPLVLSFFPWTEVLSRRIVGYALTPLFAAWDGFIGYVPNIFYILVFVFITRLALKAMHAVFGALGSGAITIDGFYPEWAEPTYKIARLFVLALAIVVIFPYLPGASTDAFKGVSLFIGVLLSFGSTAAIGNMIAGVVLTYTRAFNVGDRVLIGDTVGDVTEKTLLVTRIRTNKNEEVTLPNGAVLGGTVKNYSRLNSEGVGLMLHTEITIGYDVPWRQVEQLLIDSAKKTEHILPTPAPFVLQTKLNDFYVHYELNAATDRPELQPRIYAGLHANIQDVFAAAGVEIMSPHYKAERDGSAITIPKLPQS